MDKRIVEKYEFIRDNYMVECTVIHGFPDRVSVEEKGYFGPMDHILILFYDSEYDDYFTLDNTCMDECCITLNNQNITSTVEEDGYQIESMIVLDLKNNTILTGAGWL